MRVLPEPVGPQMTGIVRRLLSAKATLELGPGELHDRGATMHVMRRQCRSPEGNEERAHLGLRQVVARLDGSLARHRSGEFFMTRVSRALAITSQRSERLSQAALGVESR